MYTVWHNLTRNILIGYWNMNIVRDMKKMKKKTMKTWKPIKYVCLVLGTYNRIAVGSLNPH